MEFVALSSRVLNYLARDDPLLKKYFHGTHPADQLPLNPVKKHSTAYIVNTDPASKPGEHWLAIWTQNGVCEVFDSYGLPLSTYKQPDLQRWIGQWKFVVHNQDTLQALHSQTCGHYALVYLKAKARGDSLLDFMSKWHGNNLVLNDTRVSQQIRELIKEDLDEEDGKPRPYQTNRSRQAFITCHNCE